MTNVRPLVDYLSASTAQTLDSFELARMNRSANSGRQSSTTVAEYSRPEEDLSLPKKLKDKNASSRRRPIPSPLTRAKPLPLLESTTHAADGAIDSAVLRTPIVSHISFNLPISSQLRRDNVVRPSLVAQGHDDEAAATVDKRPIAFARLRAELLSSRLRRLKCIPIKKQLLKMAAPSLRKNDQRYDCLVEVPLLRTGTA